MAEPREEAIYYRPDQGHGIVVQPPEPTAEPDPVAPVVVPVAQQRSLLEKAADAAYVPTRADIDQAEAESEAAWTQHWAIRTRFLTDLMGLVRRLEGRTGLVPDSGAEALMDQLLQHLSEQDELGAFAATARQGFAAQQVTNALKSRFKAPAARPKTYLTGTEVTEVRERLRVAPAEEVQGWLDELPDTGHRISWTTNLLAWAEEDGATAQVLQVLKDAMAEAFTARLAETSAS